MEETMEEKVTQCSVATDCFDGFVDDIEWYGVVERSLDEMIDDDLEVPDALIDYDSCDIAVSHLMAEEFIESLSDHERYIVKCLLDGMTHGEISDTMDCTRQSVGRCVERICRKANDFLSYN